MLSFIAVAMFAICNTIYVKFIQISFLSNMCQPKSHKNAIQWVCFPICLQNESSLFHIIAYLPPSPNQNYDLPIFGIILKLSV